MKIDVPFTKLKTIAHCADIHIRLYKRHDEYREVFASFYDQLRKADLTEGVIVVAGDILHAKTDMTPELIELASEFLRTLADIAPTLVIAGNHDLNLSNMNRLDSLTPIIKNLNHPNLHYLKHSGVYEIADADFAVLSILDSRDQWPSAKDCRKKAHKIAMYHGPVNGAQTDIKYVITDRHVDSSTFGGYDIVLLGDIHRYQVLQESNPVIVYSSSLIQQNHGESLRNHGWCLWNVGDRIHKFIEVPNSYGYYTLELQEGNINFPTDMPENVRLRLFTGNASPSLVKKTTAALRKRYNVIDLSTNKNKINKSGVSPNKKLNNVTVDVTNVDTQNSLIQDWIERHHETVDDELMKRVISINNKLNSQINHEDHSRNINWRPLKFTFSNMFSYGENNEIDFERLNGVHGIFAQNASGKSSSMDAFMFCLYDKTPRAFRGDHIMNNRRTQFECELKFEINQEIYYIRRTGTRKKTGEVKVDVSFWREDLDGTHISLNGEDRRSTNANIRNYVGSYEDFVLTTLSSQTGNALFIDKSHSERKDLLIQFMGLNVFDTLQEVANEECKEITSALKKFKKTDYDQLLADTQNRLESAKVSQKTLENNASEVRLERDRLDSVLKEWQGKKLPVPNITLDIDILQSNRIEVINLIETYIEQKAHAETRLDILNEEIKSKTEQVLLANLPELRNDRSKEQVEKDIQLFITNEDNIRHNTEIEVHVAKIERDISINKRTLDDLEKQLRDIYGEIKVSDASKTEIMKHIKEAEELEDNYEAYKYYMLAVGRDGIPYEMMARAIPAIESEINNILTQVSDFTISLEVDGKNILGKLNYDHERVWPLENSSGMERFISSLAIRVALLNASNLPKPNFMIIDEGLGTLDAENIGAMATLMGILKSQFDFIVLISHLEAARDMVDKVIEIKREDGFSYINV